MPTTYEYLQSGGSVIKIIPRIITDCGTKSFDEFEVVNPNTSPVLTPIKYGALYNAPAIVDERKITSSDEWIVSSKPIWLALRESIVPGATDYVGNAGGVLKETGIIFWDTPNEGATNALGFSARAAGYRTGDVGTFSSIGTYAQFHTSTDYWGIYWWGVSMAYNTDTLFIDSYTPYKTDGLSVRLCNPSTTNPEGHEGFYYGNDGKIYRTKVIYGVEWILSNLNETKFRDGSWISGFDGGTYTPISNATWAAATIGMMCFYGDNPNNA